MIKFYFQLTLSTVLKQTSKENKEFIGWRTCHYYWCIEFLALAVKDKWSNLLLPAARIAPKRSTIFTSYRKEIDFLMVIMASGIVRRRVRTTTTTTAPAAEWCKMAAILQLRLTETCSSGSLRSSSILDIDDTVNCDLSKQVFCWLVSRDQSVGSVLELIKTTCFLIQKLTDDQVLVFDWIAGSWQVKLLQLGLGFSEAG